MANKQQWGKANKNARNTFPVAFNTIYVLHVSLGAGDGNDYGENPYSINTTGFNLGDRGSYYTAIGK